MFKFIKSFFGKPETVDWVKVRESVPERKKRRCRSHSLVAGDRVNTTKLVEVTTMSSYTRELKLVTRQGTVIKNSNGFNHEILFDGDDVSTRCNYTYHIRLINVGERP